MTPGQCFYRTGRLTSAGGKSKGARAIYINPALVTITDGLIATTPALVLQGRVLFHVARLLEQRSVQTFHVDVNFADYQGFGPRAPEPNDHIFTPRFVGHLNRLTRRAGAFLNLHLLSDDPAGRLQAYRRTGIGAVCFQLDAVPERAALIDLVDQILAMGACASPVVELVGAPGQAAQPLATVETQLNPVLDRLGMLTLQAAGTATRSHLPAGTFARAEVACCVRTFRPLFSGTFQFQGGITTRTVGQAAALGAQFLVCGTQIFRNQNGYPPGKVVRMLLQEAGRGRGRLPPPE